MSKETEEAAHLLEATGGHFARDDWQWTRKNEIRHIRYVGDWTKYNAPWRRLVRSFTLSFGRLPAWERSLTSARHWSKHHWELPFRVVQGWFLRVWATFVVQMRTEKNLPDGHIPQAAIICFWEEDGEYLMLVQPSVGLLVADFLKQDSENPHAVAIAAEINKQWAEYLRRAEENGGDYA